MNKLDSDKDVNIMFRRFVFQPCPIYWFLIKKHRAQFILWLHVYSVSDFYHKSFLLHFGTSWARLEKRMIQSAQNCREDRFHLFHISQSLVHGFHIFHVPGPKSVFWGLWTFWGVQFVIDLFTMLWIFYKFGLIRDTSWSYICY